MITKTTFNTLYVPQISIRIDQYCNYILFTKLLWRENSEGTLLSSNQAATWVIPL